MAAPPWDYIAKLVCTGDSGCGKSSLTIRLCEGRFVAHHDVTIGVEFGSRIVPVGPPHSSALPSQYNEPDQQHQPASPNAAVSTAAPGGQDARAPPKPLLPAGLPRPPVVANTQQQPQKHMKLSLWDTAGQETYRSVTRSYYRGASGALLVFDLCRRDTFLHAIDWLNDLRQIAEPDIVVVLVGNKADLAAERRDSDGGASDQQRSGPGGAQQAPEQTPQGLLPASKREVTRDEAEAWARRNGVLEYVETSAKSGEGVERAFSRVAERIFQNIMAGRYDLNDRRSGVKGPSAAGFGAGVGAGANQVRLGKSAKGGGGGCC